MNFKTVYKLLLLSLFIFPSLCSASVTGINIADVAYVADADTINVTVSYLYETPGDVTSQGFVIRLAGTGDDLAYTFSSPAFGPLTFVPSEELMTASYAITGLNPSSTYLYTLDDAEPLVVVPYASGEMETTSVDGVFVDPGDIVTTTGTPTDDAYYFLAPLPIEGSQVDASGNQFINIGANDGAEESFDFGDYFNGLLKFAIGIAGALAVVMIVVGGIQYMSTDNFGEKAQGKEHIKNAVGGMILLIGAYMILNTLNPNLVDFNFKISGVSVSADGIITLSDEEYYAITGVSKPLPAAIDTAVNSAATATGLEYCQIKALVEKESRGDAGAIGHDENVSSTPAHTAYKSSGKTFKGVTFPTGDAPPKNDDTVVCGEPNLCLDWRFSHGIGLMQLTYFTNGMTPAGPTLEPKTFNKPPKELLDLTTNVSAGAEFLKTLLTTCDGDLFKAYSAYNSGYCTPEKTEYATSAIGIYNACKAG